MRNVIIAVVVALVTAAPTSASNAVLASMRGCPSLAVPVAPVPVRGHYTRCDPARLGWAAEGSLWWEVQQPLAPAHIAGVFLVFVGAHDNSEGGWT
jgi:hypothetical protein